VVSINYLDPTNKLLIFIGWWVNYLPFFKDNLKKNPHYSFVNEIDFNIDFGDFVKKKH